MEQQQVICIDPESQVQLKTSGSVEPFKIISKKTISSIKVENEKVHQETEIERCQLSYLQSSFFATVLENSITQLRILAQCNTELKIIQTESNMDELLALKFGIEQAQTQDEFGGCNLQDLSCDYNKIKKLDEDRKYINNVVFSTYIDLSLYGSFDGLKFHIDAINDLNNYRLVLEEDEAKNKLVRRDVYKQLRQQRNHIKSAIYDCDCVIDELKANVEDSSTYSEVRSRFIDNWQQARTEQNTHTIHDKESVHTDSIEYFKLRNEHEHRVHSEVELLGNIVINETLEKVESWMNKYDKDMENIDLKIQIKKNEYQNMRDKRIGYETLIDKHDVLMKDWIHFKEEREKARLYHEKMTTSAIIVQAWWRGLLVRLQLGPYKVSKKKGGKKK